MADNPATGRSTQAAWLHVPCGTLLLTGDWKLNHDVVYGTAMTWFQCDDPGATNRNTLPVLRRSMLTALKLRYGWDSMGTPSEDIRPVTAFWSLNPTS